MSEETPAGASGLRLELLVRVGGRAPQSVGVVTVRTHAEVAQAFRAAATNYEAIGEERRRGSCRAGHDFEIVDVREMGGTHYPVLIRCVRCNQVWGVKHDAPA